MRDGQAAIENPANGFYHSRGDRIQRVPLDPRNRYFLLATESLNLDRLITIIGRDLLTLENHVLIELAHGDHLLVRGLGSLHVRLVRARKVDLVELKIV